MRKLCEAADLFVFGAMAYCLCEVIWSGRTHWTMGILGGAMFLTVGELDAVLPEGMGMTLRAVIGGAVITAAEFLSGCLLNLGLGMDVWDYSYLPLNFLGQVCLPYSLMWIALSAAAIVINRCVRRFAWNEKTPRQKLL